MSLENAFIEQLAQYIEINYKEYLPVTDENILYEKYAPFPDRGQKYLSIYSSTEQ